MKKRIFLITFFLLGFLFIFNYDVKALSISDIIGSIIEGADTYNIGTNVNLMKKTIGESTYVYITGTGQMNDYLYNNNSNWKDCTHIIIGEGVTNIGNYIFSGCTELKGISISSTVTSIGEYAFYNCSKLTEVEIPNNVANVKNSAFWGCSSLSKITILNSQAELGGTNKILGNNAGNLEICGHPGSTAETYANSNSINFTKIWDISATENDNVRAELSSDGVLTIRGIGRMRNHAGSSSMSNSGWRSCKKIIIEDGITNIGDIIFYDCKLLEEITIPSSVTTIGNYAFNGCTLLSNITIPDSVTTIGNYAFSGCTSLTDVIIPKSVESIGNSAFYGCDNIKIYVFEGSKAEDYVKDNNINHKTVPSDTEKIWNISATENDDVIALLSESGVLTISGTGNMKDFEGNGNQGWRSCTQVKIENGVINIGNKAFSYCPSLTDITIPNSVTTIGNNAFSYCTSLKEITIPNSVTNMGDSTFEYCNSLKEITIPNSVTNIGNYTFNHTILTDVTIPDSVTTIGNSAFSYTSLKNVTIPDSVTTIGDGAFSYTNLEKVIIPNSVITIGNSAFSYNRFLTDIIIPDSVETLGEHLFSNSYYVTIYCKSGGEPFNYAEEHSIKYVIDDEAPKVEVKPSTTLATTGPVTLTVTAVDNDGGVGLPEKAYSFDNGEWQEKTEQKYLANNSNIIIKVRDKLGNIKTVTTSITNIGDPNDPGDNPGSNPTDPDDPDDPTDNPGSNPTDPDDPDDPADNPGNTPGSGNDDEDKDNPGSTPGSGSNEEDEDKKGTGSNINDKNNDGNGSGTGSGSNKNDGQKSNGSSSASNTNSGAKSANMATTSLPKTGRNILPIAILIVSSLTFVSGICMIISEKRRI